MVSSCVQALHLCLLYGVGDTVGIVFCFSPIAWSTRSSWRDLALLRDLKYTAMEPVDAILVNPFATDAIADRIKAALTMPREERRWRTAAMRAALQKNNVNTWAADLLSTAIASGEERHAYAYRGSW